LISVVVIWRSEAVVEVVAEGAGGAISMALE